MGHEATLGGEGPQDVNIVNIVDKFSSDVADVELIRRELPLFDGIYIKGQLQGVDVDVTVDTGASVTLVATSVYEAIPSKDQPALTGLARKIRAADGAELACVGQAVFHLRLGKVLVTKPWWWQTFRMTCCLEPTYCRRTQKALST